MFLFGVLVWLIPFAISFGLFWLDDLNHNSYVWTLCGITTLSAICCAGFQLRSSSFDARVEGLLCGLMWLVVKVGLDLIALRIQGGDLIAWLTTRVKLDAQILVLALLAGFYFYEQNRRIDPALTYRHFHSPGKAK
jgi:hypothetical protein